MQFKYNPNKHISILEISPSQINLVSGLEVFLNKNKRELSRFEIDYHSSISEYETTNNELIDVLNFVEQALPKISESLVHLNRRNPQAFCILLIGFNNIKNSNELKKLILKKINNEKIKADFLKIEYLDISSVSYYGFLSLINTTNEKAEYFEKFPLNLDFYTKKCVHFYLDTNETIFTLFQGENFHDTESFSLNLNAIADQIQSKKDITKDYLEQLLNNTEAKFIKELKKLNINDSEINVWVISGIDDSRNEFSNSNSRGFDPFHNPHRGKMDKEHVHMSRYKIDYIMDDLLEFHKGLKSTSYYGRSNFDLLVYKRFVFFIFMQSFYRVFDAKNVCFNKANSKIGYYYNLIEELKNP